ncbi:hypothetical protein EDD18DRAFT_1436428 [Armillaria luteobubalina]|uniref:Uncharacterized protein n=1 Tax=Armillaria luteobubalina TaxID=153913 RepID=A0AA39PC62_9AGAR|nr:hypothetical protein EDD18DRAFT_1436428 [Armillaria luteobubalina]
MSTNLETDIATPKLTESQVNDMFHALDIQLNTTILFASLHGFYTGVMVVSLWTIGAYLPHLRVFSPLSCNDAQFEAKIVYVIEGPVSSSGAVGLCGDGLGVSCSFRLFALLWEWSVNWAVLYSSFILATLIWCTILIIYRILKISSMAAAIRSYRRAIEVIVDSAFLYSAILVILLVFEVRNNEVGNYLSTIAIEMRGTMPTILVGRIAAGHTRPDECWSDSRGTLSSLEFVNHSISQDSSTGRISEGELSLRRMSDLEEGLEEGRPTSPAK